MKILINLNFRQKNKYDIITIFSKMKKSIFVLFILGACRLVTMKNNEVGNNANSLVVLENDDTTGNDDKEANIKDFEFDKNFLQNKKNVKVSFYYR